AMNLSDKELLELNQLCNGLEDGILSEKQKHRLSSWLASSEEARRYYIRAMALSASLYSYASEMQLEPPEAASTSKLMRLVLWWFAPLGAAACLLFALGPFGRPKPEAP